ncbi:unnamed protein product [Caenorhabditis brenneri]
MGTLYRLFSPSLLLLLIRLELDPLTKSWKIPKKIVARRIEATGAEQFIVEWEFNAVWEPFDSNSLELGHHRRQDLARSSTRLTSNEPDPVSESSDDQFYEAGEDRQPRKKKRKQVITSDEEEEDDSSTPPPSNQPSTSDGRVREADKYGMDKYARPTPTLELASDKRRRK